MPVRLRCSEHRFAKFNLGWTGSGNSTCALILFFLRNRYDNQHVLPEIQLLSTQLKQSHAPSAGGGGVVGVCSFSSGGRAAPNPSLMGMDSPLPPSLFPCFHYTFCYERFIFVKDQLQLLHNLLFLLCSLSGVDLGGTSFAGLQLAAEQNCTRASPVPAELSLTSVGGGCLLRTIYLGPWEARFSPRHRSLRQAL